jgi:hypothetical protein
VLKFCFPKFAAYGNGNAEFLKVFPGKGLFVSLAFFGLAAGEFPLAPHITAGKAAGYEEAVFFGNNTSNGSLFHN